MQGIINIFFVLGMSFFITSTPPISVENPCNIMFPNSGNGNWGDGLYLIPNQKIPIYRNKSGTKFGELSKENSYIKFLDNDGQRRRIQLGDIEYIGSYSMSFLKAKGSDASYIEVFWNTFDFPLYVKKEDLAKRKAKFFTYKKLLYSKSIPIDVEEYRNWASLGVNLTKNCLNLRKGPSTNDAVIRCISSNKIKGQEFSHFSILETKGNWAKVEVASYILTDDAQSECDYSEHRKEIGWIKAIDDNGFPNIWFSVTNQ